MLESGPLEEVELRALGCLVEKQLTTPQYYPLTINALVNACNQTSNRSPVMHVDEGSVHTALRSLRDHGLARAVHNSGDRVTKYRHVLDEALDLEASQIALLGVLFLRGPQTPGELRGRTERMATFASVDDVESTLNALGQRTPPLVARLERQPGQKEARYAHLLAGEVTAAIMDSATVRHESSSPRADRLSVLEGEVASLRAEVEHLHDIVNALRAGVPGSDRAPDS